MNTRQTGAERDLLLKIGPDVIWTELRKPWPDFRRIEDILRAMPLLHPQSGVFQRAVEWIVRCERDGKIDLGSVRLVEARLLFAQIVAAGRMAAARLFANTCDRELGPGWRTEEVRILAGAPVFPLASRLNDRPDKDVQVCRINSSTTFLVFCGRANRFGCALNTIDLYFQPLAASVVYLRDFNGSLYLEGIKSIGDFPKTVAVLRRMLSELGTTRVVCFGNSGGGYGALLYGDALAVDQVICLSGRSTLNRMKDDAEIRPEVQRMSALMTGGQLSPPDLIGAYAKSRIPVRWFYGELNSFDAYHAHELATAGAVSLEPVAGWEYHNIIGALAQTGRLHAIFRESANPDVPR